MFPKMATKMKRGGKKANSVQKSNKMKKVNKQCLLDTPRTVRVSEKLGKL